MVRLTKPIFVGLTHHRQTSLADGSQKEKPLKIHFGFLENYGDYESPAYGCDEVVCGCPGETATENATSNWDEVTCKKCLRLKEKVTDSDRRDNEEAARQLGDMADFFKKQEAQQVIQPDNAQ